MKKIAIILVCVLLLTACSPREKVELDNDGYEVTDNQDSPEIAENPEEDENSEDEEKDEEQEDEEETFDGTCYKVENSGFEMTVDENWTALDLAEPMGAMLLRGGDMTNCATVLYATGELKEQTENDLEGVFEGLKADDEINDYKITRSDVDGYYRILLTYNQIEEDKSYTFNYVVYQQTSEGLLNINFKIKDQYPNEIKNMINSIRPQTDNAVEMPKE